MHVAEVPVHQVRGEADSNKRRHPARSGMGRQQTLDHAAAQNGACHAAQQEALPAPLLDQKGAGKEHGYGGSEHGVRIVLGPGAEQHQVDNG